MDAILASAAGWLAGALSLEEGHPEDYSDFVFSSGWLSAFKARSGIRRQKLRGDGGEYDQALKLIPQHQAILQDKTADFAQWDIFNCDELALQYNLRPDCTLGPKSTRI
ncbi:hypothetical protein L211DRAFT_881583 [Terfezia boudieri ATCC MYA-4762]|uniref:HTH CENPB-type domain-containing protein n=1 Tax=Terfezia boudieri ATCC MYA-4762 TaxID=1051890 RepID=A0A3N4M9I6_9PEZI|nr:hypothetical protein L211DRAFT_881583 [Terfezia boudieri ATCC MYA-4762]